ncbi:hypothetical protein J3U91_00058 [Oenococcus oeni]|nr:hypothetical protein AC229_0691 [Oenococcus oeni]UCU85971.1 hypothetical protein J3U91_00058 [Oenococcus oeni]
MTTLIICLIILAMEILPIGSWLASQGLRYVLPILFSLVLLATFVLSPVWSEPSLSLV